MLTLTLLSLLTVSSLAGNVALGQRCSMLKAKAYKDTLTPLYNKRAFIERKQSKTDTYILFDVCFLKLHNDINGHVAGDRLLSDVGQLINDVCRKSEIGYHLSGDEFLIVVKGDKTDADTVIERLENALSLYRLDPDGCHSADTPVELAYGIGGDIETADKAMYDHKAGIHGKYNYTRLSFTTA